MRGNQLPPKSNYSTFATTHRHFNSPLPCSVIYKLPLFFLTGGIFGVRPSVTERDVCLPRSNWVIPQITSSYLTVPPSLCLWKTRRHTRPRWRGSAEDGRFVPCFYWMDTGTSLYCRNIDAIAETKESFLWKNCFTPHVESTWLALRKRYFLIPPCFQLSSEPSSLTFWGQALSLVQPCCSVVAGKIYEFTGINELSGLRAKLADRQGEQREVSVSVNKQQTSLCSAFLILTLILL